ncbi:hypothetical protein ACTA71_009297 [Dictyostelium dimigraforme]
MATIFDILNTINNKNDIYGSGCKRKGIDKIDIIPPIDVSMTESMFVVEIELAGISKGDIEIDIKDSILTIKGEKKNNSFDKKRPLTKDEDLKLSQERKSNTDQIFMISERSFGKFKRQINLAKVLYQLDLSSIKTNFENGVLTITFNKKLDYSDSLKISIN